MPAYRTHARTTGLEVTTGAPQPPTLSIISPTPRAFTFASASASTPFASPSSSPFEPDLKPLRLHTPPIVRMLTPESAASASSPTFSSPTSSHRHSPVSPERAGARARSRSRDGPRAAPPFPRRKSTGGVSEPLDRPRPKKGDEDYVKRPENAFILFRRKCVEDRLQAQEEADAAAAAAAAAADAPAAKPKKHRQADLSKMISQQWRALAQEERTYWEALAKEKKKEHEQLHPGYVYRPQRTKAKNAKPGSKKGKARAEGEPEHEESVSFVLPLPPSPTSRHGRSNSAPNAQASAQTIRLPVVHMPSVPSSPLMLPQMAPLPVGRRPSYDWARVPHRPLEPQYMQGLFQPSFAPQQELPMDYQHAPQFFQGMYELSGASPVDGGLLPPLMAPSQLYSPADTVSPATPFSGGPFAQPTDWTRLSMSSMASDDSAADFQALPDLYEQPWAFEFVGEYVPGGADFLTDDSFDLSKIPTVALEELCPQEPASADGAGAAHHHGHAHGQDPFAGLFFSDDMMGAGRY